MALHASSSQLQRLIIAGLLTPGPCAISLSYQGQRFEADVIPPGIIVYQGRAFETPSGWALAVIRSVNPARKAVDGWKAVKHKGELLGNLLAQMHSDIDAAAAHAAVVAAAAAAADMDQAVGVHHSAAPPKPPTPSNRVPQQPAPRSLATHREDSGQSSDATTSNPSTHRRKRSKPCAAQ